VNNDNQIDFDTLKNGHYVVDSARSDHFVYTERIDAAYLELESKLGSNTNLTMSVRGEHTHFTAESVNPARHADSSYFNLFPNVQLSHQIDKSNLLTLSYSRTIGRPNYQDLNPFVSYVDQFYSSTGNPFLRPDFINTYRISDFIADKYRVSLSTIITNNYYQIIFDQKATGQYFTTKANLGTRYQYMIEFNLPFDLTSWWHVDAQLDASHERYSYKNYAVPDKTTNNFNINVTQNFKLTSKLSAQLINEYQSPTYYVISQYQYLAWTNVGLRYSILKDKGAIRLAVSDVFNSYFNKYTTTFNGMNIFSRDKIGSRFVTATFTYHFGTTPARTKIKTTEEQKRLNGSAEN